MTSETTILTPPVRLSFPSLFKPKPKAIGVADLVYQTAVLIPPDVDLAPFHAAMRAAALKKWKDPKVKLSADRNPIRAVEDLDKRYAGYDEGWHVLNMANASRPPVVDQRNIPLDDESRIYPGVWVRVFTNCYAWEFAGKRGCSFSLDAVQLVRDDERLDGRPTIDPSAVFTPLDDTDDKTKPNLESLFG